MPRHQVSLDGTLRKVVQEDTERMEAAWAAVCSDGEVNGGKMGPDARDNYMAELAAQLAVARGD